jgi:hypothetical protein
MGLGPQIHLPGPTPAIDTCHVWQFISKNRRPNPVHFLPPVHVSIAGVGPRR